MTITSRCATLAFVLCAIAVLPARAQERPLTVVHYGGTFGQAMRTAYFDPAEKEMGIKIVDTSRTDMDSGGHYFPITRADAFGNLALDFLTGSNPRDAWP